MEIVDSEGKPLEGVTARLSPSEMTELLLAASQIDDGEEVQAVLRDGSGTMLALELSTAEPEHLVRHMDWWLGPLILIVVLLVIIGAYTVAGGLIRLFF